MDTIFHEKQEGQLCAQHCLNALLQGPYYTAVDLASLAQQLDEEEREQMAVDVNSEEYQRFIAQPSGNMDDTGFFSVQVIARAIHVWGLELVSFSSSDARAVMAKMVPTSQQAFICNYREHWLTVRKLGNQWFNLNSLLTAPELISDTYLGMFLAQLEGEGYTVYVVLGELPSCTADQVLRLQRVTQAEPPPLIGEAGSSSGSRGAGRSRPKPAGRQISDEDEELQRALALSLEQQRAAAGGPSIQRTGSDADLELAMRLSQRFAESSTVPRGPDVTGAYDIGSSLGGYVDDQSHVVSEEDELQRAIQLSLQATASGDPPPAPTRHIPIKVEPRVQPSSQAESAKSPNAASASSPTSATPKSDSTTASSSQLAASTVSAPSKATPTSSSNPIPMAGTGNRVGGDSARPGGRPETNLDADEIRRRRLAYLEKQQQNPKP